MGWTALWILVWILVQVAASVVYVIVQMAAGPSGDPAVAAQRLEHDGLVLGLITAIQTPFLVGLTAILAWIRLPLREYLALKPLRWKQTLVCVLLLIALVAAQDTLTWLIDEDIVPPFMAEVYRTAGFLPLLVFALVVAAPVAEETFFRGLMYTGLAASRAGHLGAVLITSAVWALIHVQYDWYGIGCIFVGGLFLGLVRWRTGSATLTIVLHAVSNAIATAEVVVVVDVLG